MQISNTLKQRFCKDENISIQVFDSPYFEQRLELLDHLDRWNRFLTMIEYAYDNNEQAFFEDYNNVKDRMINYIKSSEAFNKLNADNMNKFKPVYNFSSKDVYKETNLGKTFISIDICKANFSALVHYSKNYCDEDFFKEYSYNNFMKQFTDNGHFIGSKYIRQVVFGNCNPARQVTYERYLIDNLIKRLIDNEAIKEEHIYSAASDELIIYADELFPCDINKIKKIAEQYDVPLKFEVFKLGRVLGSSAFIKVYEDGKIKPKCVNSFELPFVMRLLRGEEVTEDDKVFYHEKRLAKYLEVPELKLEI